MPQGVELATAYVSITASASGISRSIQSELDGPVTRAATDAGDRAGRGFGSTFGRGMTAAVGAIAALGIGREVVGFLGDAVEGARESQRIAAITAQVIETTGGVANVSAAQVGDYAERLAGLTGVDDEVIQSGQNMLLTFTNVRNELGEGNDVFDRATSLANDMSSALGQDMASSAMQLGKALNDPIVGVSALSRVGVSFTEQQKEQISTLQESGDMLGAQGIILEEVARQFGGTAEATATPMDRLKVTLGNLQEEIGARLIPVFDRVASWLSGALPGAIDTAMGFFGRISSVVSEFWYSLTTGFTKDEGTGIERFALKVRDVIGWIATNVPPVIDRARDVIERLVTGFVRLGQWVVEHKPVLIGLTVAIGVGLVAAFVAWAISAASAAVATLAAAAPIILIGLAIAALVAGVIWAYQNWDWFREAIDRVARYTTEYLWPALQKIASFIMEHVVPAIGAVISHFIDTTATVIAFVGDVVGKFDELVGFVTGLPQRIRDAASGMWDGIKDAFRGAINWIIGAWNGLEFRIPGFDPPGPGPSFGGFTLGVPDIPLMSHHTGGVVSGSGDVPILAEGGERVIPADVRPAFDRAILEFANGGDQRSTTIENVNVTTDDPRQFYNETLWRLAG